MNELTLSVVIPAYNEEQNLPPTVHDLQVALQKEQIPYEIILVNDNSRDKTAEVIGFLMAQDHRIRTVNRLPPGGFGRAIRTGLEHVQGDCVVICMADSSDDPQDVVRYYRKLEEGYDCVFGSRFMDGAYVENYPRFKLIMNRIVNRCIQLMFLCPYNDLTNAFKAYRTEVIRSCSPFHACHFNLTIEMSLGALIRRYNITQIPIRWYGRKWGSSNLSLAKMGRRYLATLVRAFAERVLISDDLVAERLAHRTQREDRLKELEARIARLEDAQVLDSLQSLTSHREAA
ncbi:MAG: glycosyltransferase family 2 protein [Planctomycetes bacterium]|nr:glycosyltransferase family 2 protein [Planctomycetota bacterium]